MTWNGIRLDDSLSLKPGERARVHLEAGETLTGSFRAPVTILNGANPGPTVTITAACHPGEYNGVMASIRLGRELDAETLVGRVNIVHVENVAGVQAKIGHVSPIDGVNMGRAFPVPGEAVEITGNVSHQAKSPTYSMAEEIFDRLIVSSDAYIDLHGGELFEFVPPNIEYLLTGEAGVDDATRRLAQAFGFPILWEVPTGSIPEMPTYPGRGSAVYEAQLRGVPSVFCEVGGEGRLDRSLVQLTVDGVLRVLASLGMIAEAASPPAEPQLLIGGHVLFASRAGMFLTQAGPADTVEVGDILGEIIDLSGEIAEQFIAPARGVLVNVVTRGIANPGDMLYVLGRLS
jgi:hypothetical protein